MSHREANPRRACPTENEHQTQNGVDRAEPVRERTPVAAALFVKKMASLQAGRPRPPVEAAPIGMAPNTTRQPRSPDSRFYSREDWSAMASRPPDKLRKLRYKAANAFSRLNGTLLRRAIDVAVIDGLVGKPFDDKRRLRSRHLGRCAIKPPIRKKKPRGELTGLLRRESGAWGA